MKHHLSSHGRYQIQIGLAQGLPVKAIATGLSRSSSTGRAMPWLFMQDDQPIELHPHSTVQVSEDPLGAVVLARAAMGLVQTMGWIANSHAAELTEVLQPFAGRTRPFYVLYPQNRHLAARVRVLVDYLILLDSSTKCNTA
jgi:DNA-binding transcriptional LysR family regulator